MAFRSAGKGIMGGGGDGDADNETGTSKSNVGPVAAVAGGRSGGGGDGGGDEGGEGMMQTSSFAFMHITPESEISSWQQRPAQPRP